ncbi:MAG: hypothetical protein R3F53_08565 [Gammaproteobacteria bacterium]
MRSIAMIEIVTCRLSHKISVLPFMLLAALGQSGNVQAEAAVVYAQRNSQPTEVCVNQVSRRFNVSWSEVEARADRFLNDGAVLVNWRTRRDSGYCEVSARGDLQRFVIESDSGIGYLDDNPLQECADEVARQRNVARQDVRVERRSGDENGRITVAWQTRTEQGYCEVSRRGRVEYFKVTQAEADHSGGYRTAERVCMDAVAEQRRVARRDVSIVSTEAAGKRLRVNWRTPDESGFCEIDRKNHLHDFQVLRSERSQERTLTRQEYTCTRFIANRLKLQRESVRIRSSEAAGGPGSETVRVNWWVRDREGYCLIRRGIVVGSNLR